MTTRANILINVKSKIKNVETDECPYRLCKTRNKCPLRWLLLTSLC